MSDWTLQSIPGVNSIIYYVDQNPTPYSAPPLSERPVSTYVGMERTPIELESCLSAEEVHLLDKRTSIEIESFVSLRGHCAIVAELRAFLGSEKEMQYFTVISHYHQARDFITGGTKHSMAKNKYARELPKAYHGE